MRCNSTPDEDVSSAAVIPQSLTEATRTRSAWPSVIQTSILPYLTKGNPSREPTDAEDYPPRRPKPARRCRLRGLEPIHRQLRATAVARWCLFRIGELAEQVRQIWVRHDPVLSWLRDVPDPAEDDETEWAEFRVGAQARLVYETRNFDQRERVSERPLLRIRPESWTVRVLLLVKKRQMCHRTDRIFLLPQP